MCILCSTGTCILLRYTVYLRLYNYCVPLLKVCKTFNVLMQTLLSIIVLIILKLLLIVIG